MAALVFDVIGISAVIAAKHDTVVAKKIRIRGGYAIAAIMIIMDGRDKKIQDVGNVPLGILVNHGIFFDGNDRVIVGCRRRRFALCECGSDLHQSSKRKACNFLNDHHDSKAEISVFTLITQRRKELNATQIAA